MARDWIRLPSYSSKDEAEKCAPDGWQALQIEQLSEQLPVGKRFEQKTSLPVGRVPVIDQSAAGIVGWHNEAPGVSASSKSPVVTFANHTCEMRLMERPFSVIQNVFPLVGRDNVCRTKFFYYLTKGRVWLEEYKGHFPDFRRKWILCPPYRDQERLTKVLGDLDKKISLNLSSNQTLEAMAQAIFQSWFVEFDPVKAKIAAKQEGRDPLRAAMSAISGKAGAELDALPPEQYEQLAATAALFPDEMEDSELGAIPKGWTVCPLPECVDINPSRVLKKGAIAPYLDMANVPTHAARVDNVVPRAFGSGSKFINGDTLLARITPCLENGKTAYVDFLADGEVGWGSTEFIVLRPKNGLPLPFAYFLCRHPEFRAFAISQMAGTSGRQRVPNDCFGAYKVVKPSPLVADAFGLQTTQFMKQIKSLDEASKTLAGLRDVLLPRLLSGELQVQHTEPEAVA